MPIVTLPTKTDVKKCLVSGIKKDTAIYTVSVLHDGNLADGKATKCLNRIVVQRSARLLGFRSWPIKARIPDRYQNRNLTPKTVTDWLMSFITWNRSSANTCMISSISYWVPIPMSAPMRSCFSSYFSPSSSIISTL